MTDTHTLSAKMDILEFVVDPVQPVEELPLVLDVQLRHTYVDYF